ncbi:GH1 family beta-glucosidase [Auraticoccus monumenti]|uniref:Beta-glucosidase n=1 Tax=Auraticoccus monumenti TaxID=675864 RepID=A0A1G6S271_9ACTN|nr:GH1 family beta-glucosidase [Auraticoccus monumenti]SDD10929.1 broad-specificity cellobiase [Auraticoccus monumenti]
MTTFPADFVWGTATASYQIEGAVAEDGRRPSTWDTFARTPGKVWNGDTGDVACDHYHRFAEDVAIMADLGVDAYRFSVAWPRVVPEGTGAVNQAGLDFYRRVAETCLEHGVQPYVTLYHWDLPQPLEDAGGWLSRSTAEAFAEYARITHEALGDVIGSWITLNEPWCSALLGYAAGVHAPGQQLGTRSLEAAHHLLLGHGLAVQAMRADGGEAPLGITLNLHAVRAASDSEADLEAARRYDGLGNRLFLDPLLRGAYPEDVLADTGTTEWFAERSDDLATIAEPIDFIGINYYSAHTVAAPEDGRFSDPSLPTPTPGSERVVTVDTGAEKTQMGWEIHPDGLVDVLAQVHALAPGLPLYVTENGSAWPDEVGPDGRVEDEDRRRYLEAHLEACREAVARGLPLKGYFCWSLLDNFEWAFGYDRRFGIVRVDYETQQRTVKRSGEFYRDFVARERG